MPACGCDVIFQAENINETGNATRIFVPCGRLPFCEDTSNQFCYETSVNTCEQCSVAKGYVLLIFFIFLALAILFGNILIICVAILRYKKKTIGQMDYLKASLAAADLLTGLLLLIFIPYNFHWVMGRSIQEIVMEAREIRGGPLANFGSVFYWFGYTSSIYHLIFIGGQRVYAIWNPIKFRVQSKKYLRIALGLVWILAILSATTPFWFPDRLLIGGFAVPLISFIPVLRRNGEIYGLTPILVVTIIFLIIPYLLMTVVTIGAGVLCAFKLRKSKAKLQSQLSETAGKQKEKDKKREGKLAVTVLLMQLGFTITIIPLVVTSILFYSNYLICQTITIPWVTAFYLSLTNNLVNVIIYNIREKRFRSSVKQLLTSISLYFPSITSTSQNSSSTQD